MNLLVDTNVFIDYLGRKPPYFENAQRLAAAGFFGDASLWLPAQSAKDAFYALSHYVSPVHVQDALLEAFAVFKPVSLNADDLVRAARLKWDDYEDCLVALCAEHVQADYIITRDAEGFARSPVPTLTPGEWIATQRGRGIEYEDVAF
ncbi:MAG: PIN domain-containing protein [Coriobacteriia bacterium]|nr:PIN domain-containing protein [Coriobacteriia bacterium]